MDAATALRWARRWGAHHRNLGAVGRINAESGFGPPDRWRSAGWNGTARGGG